MGDDYGIKSRLRYLTWNFDHDLRNFYNCNHNFRLITVPSKENSHNKSSPSRVWVYIFSIITALASILFDLFEIPILSSASNMETLPADSLVLVLTHTFFYQTDIIFLMPAMYYMFVFARFVFIEEGQKRAMLVYLVEIMAIGAIILQFLAIILLLSSIIRGISGAPHRWWSSIVGCRLGSFISYGNLFGFYFYCRNSYPYWGNRRGDESP